MRLEKLVFIILISKENIQTSFDFRLSLSKAIDSSHFRISIYFIEKILITVKVYVKQYKRISKGITYTDTHDKCSSYRYRSISILEHNMQKSRLVQFFKKTDMFFIASNNVFLFVLCEYYNFVEFNFNIWKRRRIYLRNSWNSFL